MRRGIRLAWAVLAVALSLGPRPRRRADPLRRHPAVDRPGRADRHAGDARHPVRHRSGQRQGRRHGHKIEVLFEDNQAKPDQSVLQLQQAGRPAARAGDLHRLFRPVARHGAAGHAQEGAAGQCRRAGRQAGTASPYLINTLPTIGDEIKVLSKYLFARARRRPPSCTRTTPPASPAATTSWTPFPKAGGTILAQEPTQFGQTDYRPALLKLADAKPEVMLVVDHRRHGADGAAVQADEPANSLSRARRSSPIPPPSPIRPRHGFVHTQIRIDAPPELAAAVQGEIRRRHGFLRPAVLQRRADRADHARQGAGRQASPSPARTCTTRCSQIRKFHGLIPLEFKTNTATVPIDINEMQDGKDVTIKQLSAD